MRTSEDAFRIVQKAKRAGIDALLVDVKPLSGEVLFDSRIAPQLEREEEPETGTPFDLLDAMLSEAHPRGIEVHAAINIFSEGSRQRGFGPAFQRPEWQAVTYELVRTVTIRDRSWMLEWVDPLIPPDEPAFYTRKHGEALEGVSGRQYVAMSGDKVVGVHLGSELPVPMPEDGGVLSVREDASLDCRKGDTVIWDSEPVFRQSEDSRLASYGIFVNPIGPARRYEIRVIEELVSNYELDGIVFDRMRYPNLYADFGSASREQFEAWLSKGQLLWPTDIFTINSKPWQPPTPGRYYREWLEWRARQIREFALEATEVVRGLKPEIRVGAYVGSWYDSYYDVGVNWGAPSNKQAYSWMTPSYRATGYADLFDYICTGCYYPAPTRSEARESGRPEAHSVEAACDLSNAAVAGECPVYGSLYLLDYHDRPSSLKKALGVAMDRTDGVMLFDLVYLDEYEWWPLLEEQFSRTRR